MNIKQRIASLEADANKTEWYSPVEDLPPKLTQDEWLAHFVRGERIDRPDFYAWLERTEHHQAERIANR
ncbi:hypothetical protein [Methylococcus sp. EFPC2]|uniref:hypothetical protein n=1 Tax=Methylococcus sp. EFPC2 TaxID=2812648 RepID=UPI001967E982|nr:hypothetical protein [Methylococcus sp. EFPC2]QSA98622.1 hypothetical protein JWZ97_07465 [Methylococcus sp. EFPC2]